MLLYYLASVVLTTLIEIGMMLVASGDKYSKIHGILENEKQTAGLILILIGVNLLPIINLVVLLALILIKGEDFLL